MATGGFHALSRTSGPAQRLWPARTEIAGPKSGFSKALETPQRVQGPGEQSFFRLQSLGLYYRGLNN